MQISLLTCAPGEELYARFGHTALRVVDPANQVDIVFNYGIFDFDTEQFYWKFVKGETWYELGASSMPAKEFVPLPGKTDPSSWLMTRLYVPN